MIYSRNLSRIVTELTPLTTLIFQDFDFRQTMLYSQLYGLVATATVAGALLLQVDPGSPGHELSPLLHGLMFEDISNSGDGGTVDK